MHAKEAHSLICQTPEARYSVTVHSNKQSGS